MGGVLMEVAWQGVGNCLGRFSEKELSGSQVTESPDSLPEVQAVHGAAEGWRPEESDRGWAFLPYPATAGHWS